MCWSFLYYFSVLEIIFYHFNTEIQYRAVLGEQLASNDQSWTLNQYIICFNVSGKVSFLKQNCSPGKTLTTDHFCYGETLSFKLQASPFYCLGLFILFSVAFIFILLPIKIWAASLSYILAFCPYLLLQQLHCKTFCFIQNACLRYCQGRASRTIFLGIYCTSIFPIKKIFPLPDWLIEYVIVLYFEKWCFI